MTNRLGKADQELLTRIGRLGGSVSEAQLERWRSRGLLPPLRPAQDSIDGPPIPPRSDVVARAAVLLSRVSRRGRPWQLNAERLFNEGYPLTTKALRETASFLIGLENATMQAAWAAAQNELDPDESEFDATGLLGESVAQVLESLRRPMSPARRRNAHRRSSLLERVVEAEIAWAHRESGLSPEQLTEYAGSALTWRLVDFVDPQVLTKSEQNLARHGVAETMAPEGGGAYPLPSERLVVAQSLTLAEAEQYRGFALGRIEMNSALGNDDFGLLWVVTWIVAYERRKIAPRHLDRPLPQSQLDAAAALLRG